RNRRFLHREALLKHSKDNGLLLRRPRDLVKDPGLLKISIIALLLAVIFLIVHQTLDVSPALATLLPASVILVYESSRSLEMKHVLARINWEVFFFFGGLFLLVAGLEKTGLLGSAGAEMVHASGGSAALAITILLWSTALLSQIVDNVPLVTVLVPVISVMHTSGLPLLPLAWALALGAGIGGMATPIGTASNIVALSILNKDRKRLGFGRFAKRSIPLTILDLAIANVILLLRL
ncbi:MAG TPA: SLC13 family permease, partial [Candidatus Binatus sp.]|nr:SLC13 family permease [Candidatus Binatus sp.]